MERIKQAAIKYPDGTIRTGHRHHNIINDTYQALGIKCNSGLEVQGFVTEEGRFVDRLEGFIIAKAAGQVIRPSPHRPIGEPYYNGPELFSEDLY